MLHLYGTLIVQNEVAAMQFMNNMLIATLKSGVSLYIDYPEGRERENIMVEVIAVFKEGM